MKKEQIDLNRLLIETDDSNGERLKNNSVIKSNPTFDSVEVLFRNHEKRLIEIINQFEKGAIFGCIAWLTSEPILKALSKCEIVQIVVQKEDFLRPDYNSSDNSDWKIRLRKQYDSIKCKYTRYRFKNPINDLSVCADPTVDPIRCVGNFNSDKKSAFPRAHHKFLVFCEIDKSGDYHPVTLWTGSFNLTKNATYSFENVVIMNDNSGSNPIINSFLNEHHQIFALSEKLDWTSEWSAPEFRIGT